MTGRACVREATLLSHYQSKDEIIGALHRHLHEPLDLERDYAASNQAGTGGEMLWPAYDPIAEDISSLTSGQRAKRRLAAPPGRRYTGLAFSSLQ